jgi:hypothetical protein
LKYGVASILSLKAFATVNKEIYIDILHRLWDAVTVTPRKMENQQLVSPSLQCSSTPVNFGQVFLKKNNVTTLEYPPYFPDLAPADFYLFPRLKSALKERRFCNGTHIKNATKELKRISKYCFQKCFQLMHILWQKCIIALGDQSEGYLA